MPHEDADNLVAGFEQEVRRDTRIDAAAHREDYFGHNVTWRNAVRARE
jgi:hypothetical protein